MLTLRRILCSGPAGRALPAVMALLPLLAACGQKGDLFLPTDPAAANRATLPQVLIPGRATTDPATTPPATVTAPAPPTQAIESSGGRGTGTASPIRQP